MNQSPPKIELIAAIICDDVRREDNGKAILIGVYPTDVVVEKLPSNANFALWACVKVDRIGAVPFEFRYVGTKGTVVSEVRGEAQIADLTAVQFQLPRMPVLLEGEGQLKVEMKIGDMNWMQIHSLEVKQLKNDRTTV